MNAKDEVARILDRAKNELLALDLTQKPTAESVAVLPEWLTAEQLADYWQLRNRNGKLTTSGILKWAARNSEESPLPHARMGDLLRFNRNEVNRWAKEEAERRQACRNKTRGTQTDPIPDSKLRRTLTAVG